jgi:hypothetical protein
MDSEYRERMTTNMKTTYSKVEVRNKVSATLKKKWQDPEFRQAMLEKMNTRRKSPSLSDEYRQKISDAMKKKWQDPQYRAKAMDAMAKHTVSVERREVKPKWQAKPRPSTKPKDAVEVRMMQPLEPGEARQKVVRKRVAPSRPPPAPEVTRQTAVEKKPTVAKKKLEPDGSVNRLREERRDLFDLLYGDEPFDEDRNGDDDDDEVHVNEVDSDSLLDSLSSQFDFGDEDLDSFDPYGLDDY